ncbi:MAG: hypothetical protein CM1200mP28_04010 [Deltaproteobacteria bacterium]|nr:MAG: hypothetical protein CM1200mP28_04010 [Deltaproteobacteria bacterium]
MIYLVIRRNISIYYSLKSMEESHRLDLVFNKNILEKAKLKKRVGLRSKYRSSTNSVVGSIIYTSLKSTQKKQTTYEQKQ